MKYIETHARAFLPLNISAIGSVKRIHESVQCLIERPLSLGRSSYYEAFEFLNSYDFTKYFQFLKVVTIKKFEFYLRGGYKSKRDRIMV